MAGLLDAIFRLLRPKVVSPLADAPDIRTMFTTPTPTPTPAPKMTQYAQGPINAATIKQGMERFSPDTVPLSTMSAELSQVGKGLPDPLLPAVMGLIESGGGQHMKNNNPYNIGPGVSYPDLKTAIMGGGSNNQRGLNGILHGGLYDKYINSGNLEDFFNTYTPPGPEHNNPSMEELLTRYKLLRSLFE